MKTQAETELMQPQKRKGIGHQKLEEARKDCFLELYRKHRPANTWIPGFSPPELWEKIFLLFEAIKFAISYYCSSREVNQEYSQTFF